MATDLGAERSRNGEELKYVRARFHVECVAAGVISIDAPYTWTDDAGAEAEARHARQLGYTAKSAVNPDHAAIINQVFTPLPKDVAKAERIVAAFEVAQANGEGRVELDGSLVEVPIYRNAQTLLERAKALASY
jgi:citrate lyase subunit beta/citryl-CoA lyase